MTNQTKAFLIGGAVVLAGVGIYMIYRLRKKDVSGKTNSDVERIINTTPSPVIALPTPGTGASSSSQPPPPANTLPLPASGDSGFPLQKGSKGNLVRKLQNALITLLGKSSLPKYGADGDFGSETEAALQKDGSPTVVEESRFNLIIARAADMLKKLGQDLYNAVDAGNYTLAKELLAKIKTAGEYDTASKAFKEQFGIFSTTKSIVEGLLQKFSSESQRDELRNEFLRIGLIYDGNAWSLPPVLDGLETYNLITTCQTHVWVTAEDTVTVDAGTLLGKMIMERFGYTCFENNGKKFLVNAHSVRYV